RRTFAADTAQAGVADDVSGAGAGFGSPPRAPAGSSAAKTAGGTAPGRAPRRKKTWECLRWGRPLEFFFFQTGTPPPPAVGYLMGWASQPYGFNATMASMFPGLK